MVVHERDEVQLSSTESEKLKRNIEYLAKIDRSIAQRENGTMQVHELIEEEES